MVKLTAKILLGVALGLLVFAGIGYAFRSAAATRVFAFVVDQRQGVRCTHPELEVASSLDAVTMAPFECSFGQGPLASAQTFAATQIALDGFGVEQVRVTRAAMNFRKRDVSHIPSNALEDLANITGMRDQLIKAVLDASEMYSTTAPPVAVDQLTILRDGKRESVIHDFRMTQDGEWNRSQGSKVDVGIEGLAALRNFDRRVTPARGKLKVDIYLGDAEPGEKPDTQLRLEGTHLNRPDTRFELSLHDPDDSPSRAKPQQERAARTGTGRSD